MKRATWKASERTFATMLGGVRHPVSGRARGDKADIEGPWFVAEHKAGAVLSPRLQTALAQAKAAAAGTNKLPIVTIDHFRAGPHGNIRAVMIGLDDWLAWTGVGQQEATS